MLPQPLHRWHQLIWPLLILLLISSFVTLSGCGSKPMRPKIVRHQNPGAKSTAVEYFLPATEMPDDVKQGLHPWIRQMVGKEPADVKKLVAERWSGIQNPALQEMRDRLLEFPPDSIVVYEGEGWLSLRLTPGVQTTIGDTWYLPAPSEDEDWQGRMKKAGIENNPVLLEFVENFAGLREDIPNHTGDFLGLPPWETFPLEGYTLDDIQSIKGAKEWQGSLIVYVGRGGDSLLLHPSGRMSWWLFAEHEITFPQADFETFVRYFTTFSRKYSYPFGPYADDESSLRKP